MAAPAPHDLLAAAIAALRARGGEVRIFEGADNCVRRREPDEPPAPHGAVLPFVIEVEGLPNLFHELAHVVLLGRLAKDHATDYAKIPFDVATDAGRALLFDELACCVASASFHPGTDADAQAWFEEQVGIQDCFFGMQGELPRFFAAVAREVAAHRAELDAALDRAHAGVTATLAAAGAPPAVAQPTRRFSFDRGWSKMTAAR